MINAFKKDFAWLAIWLSCFQLLPPAAAQQPPTEPLTITVVEGQGVINNIRQRTGRDAIVRIEDEKQQPIPGASVVFTLPSQGPSGTFSNGDKTLVMTTDNQGQAAARGLKPNNLAGKLEIRVNASYQGRTASTVITQFNMAVQNAKPSGGNGKIIAILLAVGAAGAAGAVVGLRGSGSSNSPAQPPAQPPAITISAGSGTVGPPQ